MKRCKGILALLLSVMITLTFTPSIAFAGSGDVGDPDSGVVAGQQGEVQTQEGGGDVEQQPEAEAPAAEEGDGQQSEAKAH